MKITVLTSALCLLGLFAKADSIQIASNVYMAACPTSNSYLTNLSRANSAVLANADAKAYVAAGNPDRALARYGFKNAVVNVSAGKISYVFGAPFKNVSGDQCQSLLSFDAPNCVPGGKSLLEKVAIYSQCATPDED